MARSDERRRRLAVALAAGCVSATVACNAIIGLSDFEKTECPGRICPYDGGDATTFDVLPSDGGADGGDATTPRGAGPVSWAHWNMPNYTTDADVPHKPTYVVTGDTVQDSVTPIVWKQTIVPGGDVSYAAAEAACNKLGTPGDWRLPKRIELVTLLAYDREAPYIDPDKFDVANRTIWTSSEVRPFDPAAPQYWVVNFGSGKVMPQKASFVASVLCTKAR